MQLISIFQKLSHLPTTPSCYTSQKLFLLSLLSVLVWAGVSFLPSSCCGAELWICAGHSLYNTGMFSLSLVSNSQALNPFLHHTPCFGCIQNSTAVGVRALCSLRSSPGKWEGSGGSLRRNLSIPLRADLGAAAQSMRPDRIYQGMQKCWHSLHTLTPGSSPPTHIPRCCWMQMLSNKELCSWQKVPRASISWHHWGTNTVKGGTDFLTECAFHFGTDLHIASAVWVLTVPQASHQVSLYISVPPCTGSGWAETAQELRGDVRHHFYCQWWVLDWYLGWLHRKSRRRI